MKFTLLSILVIGITFAGLFVKHVSPEGDHIGLLVIAPSPSFRFRYNGGEEGAWAANNPGKEEPWWISGRYIRLTEWW